MHLGFETIGNATILAYDRVPVLVTDPWIQGTAYFGSWRLTHEVPLAQRERALQCSYVWISHGHPDHLNPDSISLFKKKKILLPDHRGGRIKRDLESEGFEVQVLPQAKWVSLSENVKILCLADVGQDAVLLLDIGGRLLINTNDCGNNGWGYFVYKLAQQYETRILTCLSSFGDADMIHFFDTKGNPIPPLCALRTPIGPQINEAMRTLGANGFIPSSSMHRYNRTDSDWANAYGTHLSDHGVGYDKSFGKLYPAFIRYNCENDTFECINPKETPNILQAPETFGDDWKESLSTADEEKLKTYFERLELLKDGVGFVEFKVGQKDFRVTLNPDQERGVSFEVPKNSLMQAIQYEIFEDLLIGNFMKTTLHGDWPQVSLHPYFSGIVCKYGDNGRAFTRQEVKEYISHYERLYPRMKYKRWETQLKEASRSILTKFPEAFRLAKAGYQLLRKLPVTRF